jgi:hypothetical protein
MSDAPAKPISDPKGKDKEILISIVKEMTESITGAKARDTGPRMPYGSTSHHLPRGVFSLH